MTLRLLTLYLFDLIFEGAEGALEHLTMSGAGGVL